MSFPLLIVLGLLLSIFASSTNIDLFTNTNFLLLLLLAIGAYFFPVPNGCNRVVNPSPILDVVF